MMIKFVLQCHCGHEFESWFSNNQSYQTLRESELVTCPECSSTGIQKALMAPNIAKRTPDEITPTQTQHLPKRKTNQLALATQLMEQIKKKTENVGDRFAEEARKIHYDEVPARPILGTASPQETKDLIDEGIEVIPMPSSRKDHN